MKVVFSGLLSTNYCCFCHIYILLHHWLLLLLSSWHHSVNYFLLHPIIILLLHIRSLSSCCTVFIETLFVCEKQHLFVCSLSWQRLYRHIYISVVLALCPDRPHLMAVSMETAHFLSSVFVTDLKVSHCCVRHIQHKMELPSLKFLWLRLYSFLFSVSLLPSSCISFNMH